ncbi:MAG TPA: methyltransferase domain-containing protein [Caulobacteraceae bacterium]|jgi:ubiquinone/menaquinone biosynthesis C-methylase UbiE|nr:methyltransferase domain-containing protein [Caulobacteraceae bacterium]
MPGSDVAFEGSIPDFYDRYLGPILFEPFAVDLAGLFAGFDGALLETAAGTGRVTRALDRVVAPMASLTASDLNQPMLERAAALVGAPRITWRQADAQALPFDDRSFDAVVCQFGVMFLPDKAAAFAEALRVLRDGGRFVFSVWDRLEANELSAELQQALGRLFASDPPQFLARAPFGYHDEAAIRRALAAAGFGSVAVETVAKVTPAASAARFAIGQCMGSPLRAEIESRRPGGLQSVIDEVSQALARRFGDGAIEARGQALVVTARR